MKVESQRRRRPRVRGRADPIGSGFVASLARPGGRRCGRKQLVALEPDVILGQATPGTTALRADAGRVTPFQ